MKSKLSFYCKQIRGVSYKAKELHKNLNENAVILFRANNINNGEIIFDDVVYVDKSRVSDEQYLKKGDIIVCVSSGSKNLVGKAAQIDFEGEFTFGAFCKVIRPKNIEPKFLGAYFQSPIYRNRISNVSQGANINNIRNEHIDELEIPIYSQIEQRQITQKISAINNLIKLSRQQLTKLDELVKSRFIEMFGDPVLNPMGWEVKKLSDICVVGSSKRVYQSEQTSMGVPFLRISDLVSRITTQKESCDLHIPEELFNKFEQQGLVPKAGDILVTARGTLGLCYIIKPDDRFYFQDGMISWVHTSEAEVNPVYISYLFDSQGIRRQIDSVIAGSTVAYLSIAQLGKFDILMPPITLQNQFADFVQLADKSKLVAKTILEKCELLRGKLMQDYFG